MSGWLLAAVLCWSLVVVEVGTHGAVHTAALRLYREAVEGKGEGWELVKAALSSRNAKSVIEVGGRKYVPPVEFGGYYLDKRVGK